MSHRCTWLLWLRRLRRRIGSRTRRILGRPEWLPSEMLPTAGEAAAPVAQPAATRTGVARMPTGATHTGTAGDCNGAGAGMATARAESTVASGGRPNDGILPSSSGSDSPSSATCAGRGNDFCAAMGTAAGSCGVDTSAAPAERRPPRPQPGVHADLRPRAPERAPRVPPAGAMVNRKT